MFEGIRYGPFSETSYSNLWCPSLILKLMKLIIHSGDRFILIASLY